MKGGTPEYGCEAVATVTMPRPKPGVAWWNMERYGSPEAVRQASVFTGGVTIEWRARTLVVRHEIALSRMWTDLSLAEMHGSLTRAGVEATVLAVRCVLSLSQGWEPTWVRCVLSPPVRVHRTYLGYCYVLSDGEFLRPPPPR